MLKNKEGSCRFKATYPWLFVLYTIIASPEISRFISTRKFDENNISFLLGWLLMLLGLVVLIYKSHIRKKEEK